MAALQEAALALAGLPVLEGEEVFAADTPEVVRA